MLFSEDDLPPLSALQHLIFCERQCALIHVEGAWAENRLTVEGRQLHERADSGEAETRGPRRLARALPIRSLRLGLSGKMDVVEIHYGADGIIERAIPIEYKRGRPKTHDADKVQLCAQAICLEEMLNISVPHGYLFYGQPRRRTEVLFDASLRALTEETSRRLHTLVESRVTPQAKYEPKCDNCSLIEICMPSILATDKSASRFTSLALARSLETKISVT